MLQNKVCYLRPHEQKSNMADYFVFIINSLLNDMVSSTNKINISKDSNSMETPEPGSGQARAGLHSKLKGFKINP